MRSILLTLILFSTSAFAGLRHLGVKDLSLEYTDPKGVGSIEKLDIGLKGMGAHPVEVEKVGETFVATTSMLNFTWMDPWKFLFDVERLSLTGANLDARHGSLDVTIPQAKLAMKGDYALRNAMIHCEGTSELSHLEDTLLENCRENLRAEADRFDVPLNFMLVDILSRFPQPEEERPLKNFTLTVKDGDFYLYFLTQVVVNAGLRAWGAIHYEDEMKTMVIRVDLIKFGIFPVTSIVMRELRDRIKDPRVKIQPPFIRFQMRE